MFVTGLSDLTLTTDVPDAGDEDVFMVKRFLFSINLNQKILIIIKKITAKYKSQRKIQLLFKIIKNYRL